MARKPPVTLSLTFTGRTRRSAGLLSKGGTPVDEESPDSGSATLLALAYSHAVNEQRELSFYKAGLWLKRGGRLLKAFLDRHKTTC